MATPPNDDSKKLFQVLADGEWHPYLAVRDAVAAAVPPGRALRRYQERVAYKRKYLNDPEYDTGLSDDERIYFGARACAQTVITSWRDRGVEYTGTNETKRIRRKPGFQSWGIEELPPDPPEPDAEPPVSLVVRIQEPADDEGVPEVRTGGSEPSEPEQQTPAAPSPVVVEQQADEPVEEGEEEDEADEELAAAWPRAVTMSDLPGCPECGLLVVSQDAHDLWHLAQDKRLERDEMALFSESEIRNLLDRVVSKQLDDFQRGMQAYLATQFAQLEGTLVAVSGLPWRNFQDPVSRPY